MALPRQVYRKLAPALEPVTLRHGMILGHIGAKTEYLYFLDRGLVSLLKVMNDGRTVEVGVIGTEGVVGVAALLGMEETAFEAVIQLDGSGLRLATAAMQSVMQGNAKLKALALRYMYFEINGLAQTAACNILHSLRERCCRWLLIASDSAQATKFEFTHEFLALMMGVHRPALSLTLEGLQQRGILLNRRGSITIIDRAALEEGACECYETLRWELTRVYGAAPPPDLPPEHE